MISNEPAKAQPAGRLGGGFGVLLVLIILGLLLFRPTPKTPEQAKAEAAKAADDDRRGFNCLDKWDGSNADLVEQIKSELRDPDSFKVDDTRITPLKDGKHIVYMRYRARNGFGGMNVAMATAEVDHSTCKATIIRPEVE